MAKRVKQFPIKSHGMDYPWDEWMDGSIWEVARGEDFPGTVASFRVNLYRIAKEYGLAIRTTLDEQTGTITFQAYEKED